MSSARSQRDPIEHVRKLLLDEAGVEKEELKKIEKVTFANAGLQVTAPDADAFDLCVAMPSPDMTPFAARLGTMLLICNLP